MDEIKLFVLQLKAVTLTGSMWMSFVLLSDTFREMLHVKNSLQHETAWH